jgi:hypothetical protein
VISWVGKIDIAIGANAQAMTEQLISHCIYASRRGIISMSTSYFSGMEKHFQFRSKLV